MVLLASMWRECVFDILCPAAPGIDTWTSRALSSQTYDEQLQGCVAALHTFQGAVSWPARSGNACPPFDKSGIYGLDPCRLR